MRHAAATRTPMVVRRSMSDMAVTSRRKCASWPRRPDDAGRRRRPIDGSHPRLSGPVRRDLRAAGARRRATAHWRVGANWRVGALARRDLSETAAETRPDTGQGPATPFGPTRLAGCESAAPLSTGRPGPSRVQAPPRSSLHTPPRRTWLPDGATVGMAGIAVSVGVERVVLWLDYGENVLGRWEVSTGS
jgi:hypothetical protein